LYILAPGPDMTAPQSWQGATIVAVVGERSFLAALERRRPYGAALKLVRSLSQSIARERSALALQLQLQVALRLGDRRSRTSSRRRTGQRSTRRGSDGPCCRRETVQVRNRQGTGRRRKCRGPSELESKSAQIVELTGQLQAGAL